MERQSRRFLFVGFRELASGGKAEAFIDVTDIPNDGREASGEKLRVFKLSRSKLSRFMSIGGIGTIDADGSTVWGNCEPVGERWENEEEIRNWKAESDRVERMMAKRAAEKKHGDELDRIVAELVLIMPTDFRNQQGFIDALTAKLWKASAKQRKK